MSELYINWTITPGSFGFGLSDQSVSPEPWRLSFSVASWEGDTERLSSEAHNPGACPKLGGSGLGGLRVSAAP